ncbi:MAG TPA: F0F1 ATP synthase subunit B [Gemmatimonadales bacterium]
MTTSLLLLAAAEPTSANPLTVDGGLMLWTLLIFGLLLVLLKRTAWPQILQAVRDREARLEKRLADAERDRTEAAGLLEQHKQLIGKARGEAQEILAKAKAMGQKEAEALLEKAHQEQEAILARAQREIGAERDKALVALRREAVDLSLAAASRLLEKNLSGAANQKIVEDYIASIGKRA